jgi:predicted small lipoprotein YifL
MNARTALPAALALTLLLAACGNKGSLVRAPADTAPVPPADAVPTMDDPTEAGTPDGILQPPSDPPTSQEPEVPPPDGDGDG